MENKNPRRSLNSARIWRRRWDSNPRDVAVNSISSRARYDRFDTPPCMNLSMILYKRIISSQPRYALLRCPKFFAHCTHRRISTAATRSTPLVPPPAAVVSLPTSIRLHIPIIISTLLWKIKGLAGYRRWPAGPGVSAPALPPEAPLTAKPAGVYCHWCPPPPEWSRGWHAG